MIMEAMLILTLQTAYSPARMTTTSQMLPTMEACNRTKERLQAAYDRVYVVSVVCVDAR
jgi:hypothetical protein